MTFSIILVLINLTLCYSFLYNFDNKITFNGTTGYFGFSVFLQKGNSQGGSPTLIVGAPKDGLAGVVHKCPVVPGGKCEVFPAERSNARNEVQKDSLFGSTIDGGLNYGDPILMCAPKFTQAYNAENWFPNGGCYFMPFNATFSEQGFFPNSERVNQLAAVNGNTIYRDAFGQVGLSLYYNEGEFILGSPGDWFWRGDITIAFKHDYVVPELSRKSLISSRERNEYTTEKLLYKEYNSIDQDSYSGYAVTTGLFELHRKKSYVIGQPRGSNVMGKVLIRNKKFDTTSSFNKVDLEGDQFGAYFGSSLCTADLNGDGLDDLLVGAPMHKGNGYEQGSVYQFMNNGNGKLEKMLTQINGNEQNLARFGTAMVNLGKIDLSIYDAVAISAPYENGGRGVIYIYLGSRDGINNNNKYRIESSQTYGFGYSMSRPVDIDNNKFVDIAVGAYKSDIAYVFKSRTVFKYIIQITSISKLQSDLKNDPFVVNICIRYESDIGVNIEIETNIRIDLDERLKADRVLFPNKLITDKIKCEKIRVEILDQISDKTRPIELKVKATETDCPTCPISSPSWPSTNSLKIPFINNCGEDQICEPDIEISSKFDSNIQSLVIGSKDTIQLTIDLKNRAESAYTCKLNITLPNDVDFSSIPTKCSAKDFGLTCYAVNPLIQEQSIPLTIDIKKFTDISKSHLSIDINLVCTNYTKKHTAKLELQYENTFKIDKSSDPTDIVYKSENEILKFYNVSHLYFIENKGPSPIENYNFIFKVPRKLNMLQNSDVIAIHVPMFKNGKCIINEKLSVNEDVTFENEGNLKILSDQKIPNINCALAEIECAEIKCTLDFMRKNEYAKIMIDLNINIEQIVQHFKKDFAITSMIEYKENSITKYDKLSSNFVRNVIEKPSTPWLWIILGIIISLVILVILIYVLKKAQFFSRPLHEKLEEEKDEAEGVEAFAEIDINDSAEAEEENKI